MVHELRAVLSSGIAQLGVPPKLSRARTACSTRSTTATRFCTRRCGRSPTRAGRATRAARVRLHHAATAREAAAPAARGIGDRGRSTRSSFPKRSRCSTGRTCCIARSTTCWADERIPRRAEGRARSRRLLAYYKSRPRPRVQRRAEGHGPHGRAAVLARVPSALPEVQRADLGVPLAAGRAVRAARDGRRLRTSGRPACRGASRASGDARATAGAACRRSCR